MRTDPGKVFGIIVIVVALLLSMVGTLLITSPSILDTDVATYVVVVMLMLPIFLFFMLKEDLHLTKDRKDAAIGVIVFVLYVLLLASLRVGLSSAFLTFRIDALLIPLIIISFATILFGLRNLAKFIPVTLYSLFASPLLLMPILLQNSTFAKVNAIFVYYVIKAFGVPVTLNGISIVSAANTSISIAGTCAPIGTFVALIMFLIPVAYLYKGGISRKVAWVFSGFLIMLLLNFIRMFIIAYYWAYSGIGQAVAVFHLFAGQILFYGTIIIMLLIAKKYGMQLERLRKGQAPTLGKDLAASISKFSPYWVLPLLFGILAGALSTAYIGATYASPVFYYGNVLTINQSSTYQGIGYNLEPFGTNAIKLGEENYNYSFAILNGPNVNNSVYIVASVSTSPAIGRLVTNYTKPLGQHSYLLKNGIRITTGYFVSGPYTFEINYFAKPYSVSGQFVSVNYEFFALANTSNVSCNAPDESALGAVNYIESGIYNLLVGNFNNRYGDVLCSAYIVANEV